MQQWGRPRDATVGEAERWEAWRENGICSPSPFFRSFFFFFFLFSPANTLSLHLLLFFSLFFLLEEGKSTIQNLGEKISVEFQNFGHTSQNLEFRPKWSKIPTEYFQEGDSVRPMAKLKLFSKFGRTKPRLTAMFTTLV